MWMLRAGSVWREVSLVYITVSHMKGCHILLTKPSKREGHHTHYKFLRALKSFSTSDSTLTFHDGSFQSFQDLEHQLCRESQGHQPCQECCTVAADATDAIAASEVVERERIDQAAATLLHSEIAARKSGWSIFFHQSCLPIKITDDNPVLIIPVSLSRAS